MQSKRDYLVSKGLAKPGRGKFSNAAKEELAKAEKAGVKFSDATGAAPVRSTEKPTGNSGGGQSDQKSEPTFTPYLTPDEYRFPENDWKSVGVDGKTYGM